LIAGPSINAVAAFGEELGWRGLLLRELEPLGFWSSSLVIGFFWGLWHLPLIAAGYNYPGHPITGPIMMIVLSMLVSPLIGYVRRRAQSVFAAAVFHGTFNAAATLVIFIRGGNAFTVGITGAAGLITLLLADVALWLHLQRHNSASGNPVAPPPS
jgi:membrane protease YdiL (CAAX protease family)